MLILGSKVKCKITGFVGILVAKTEWLNGQWRGLVQPYVDKEGKLLPVEQFDLADLEVI